MTVAERQSNAQILEVKLQKHLQAAGFKNLPLYISCDFRDDSLTVVGEHPRSLVLKAKPTFTVLEAAILEIEPEAIQQIGLCLKITGQKQPYAFHSFNMERTVVSRYPVSKSRDKSSSAIVPVSLRKEEENVNLQEFESTLEEDFDNTQADIYPVSNGVESIMVQAADISESEYNPFEATDMEPVAKKSFRLPLLTLVWLAGAGAVTAILLSFVYALSRPCVIGKCTAIANAQQLSQESAKTLKVKNTSNSSVAEARGKLDRAIAHLEAIPFWSSRYTEAQRQLQTYRSQKKNLNAILDAARLANSASLKAQNPPHAAQEWIEVQSLWSDAIAPLNQIPKNSLVYELAQKKLKEYRGNLAVAKKRLLAEEQGQNKLTVAKNNAQVTEAREGVAQLAESWQKVESGWQTSVSTLSSISKGTKAYEQAKVLLPKYETNLAKARDRKTIEEIAEDSYTQAVTSAAQARIFEQRNGWFQASEYWRKALTAAQEVPTITSYYIKARSLIVSYKAALHQVEAKLRAEKILLKARNDLDKVCNSAPKVCDFTVSNDLIAVQMTPAYVQKLQQTFLKAGDQDTKTRQGVQKHLRTLQIALEAISDNAGVPLKLYDADGKGIGNHVPGRIPTG